LFSTKISGQVSGYNIIKSRQTKKGVRREVWGEEVVRSCGLREIH